MFTPNLTIPTTNAEPPEAAAWVAYANASTNIYGTANDVTLGTDSQGNDWKTAGYWAMMRAATPLGTDDGYNFLRIGCKAPIGIQYWEIGNETFGAGYYGGGNGYCLNYAVPYPYTTYPRSGNANLSPAAYGKGVKSFSLLMKQVDPTIKIGAVVTTPPDDYSWDSYNGQHWTDQVLAQCATNIDFVIAHSYPANGSLDDGSQTLPIPGSLYPAMVNGTGSHTDGSTAGLKDEIAAYRTDATNVQIFITEFGYSGSLTNTVNGEPIMGPVNALFAADSYATWIELGVANIDFLELSVDSFLGTVATPGGVYYGVQMTHHGRSWRPTRQRRVRHDDIARPRDRAAKRENWRAASQRKPDKQPDGERLHSELEPRRFRDANPVRHKQFQRRHKRRP